MYVSGPALQDVLDLGRCVAVKPLAAIGFDKAGMFADADPWETHA